MMEICLRCKKKPKECKCPKRFTKTIECLLETDFFDYQAFVYEFQEGVKNAVRTIAMPVCLDPPEQGKLADFILKDPGLFDQIFRTQPFATTAEWKARKENQRGV